MFLLGILTLGQGITIILQAVYLSEAITKLFKGAATIAVLPSLCSFAVFFVLRYFFQWLKERISYQFAERTSVQYQMKLVKKIFTLGPRKIGKIGSGSLITLCIEGISNFRTYIELFIPRAISMIVIPLLILFYIFKMDVLSGVVLILTMPIMIVFLILIGLLAQKKIDEQMVSFHLLSNHFVDSLRGIVTLKYLGKSKSHIHAIESVSEAYRAATNRTLRLAFLSTFALDFFSSLSVAVVAVELGLRLIEGNIGLESALVILILAPEYFMPIRSFGNDYHTTMDGKDAGEKILRLLDEATEVKQSNGNNLPQWNNDSTLSITGLATISDDEERNILENISFKVKGYEKIGIIGHSGSGKSTLIDLLAGLSEASEGNFFYNDQEISSFSMDSWQAQVTYVPQHPYIFSGTVRDNIGWYAPNSQEVEIEGAVERVGLSELVESFPNGLDEVIGQGGRILSGGEEQRIALARSLLQQRPIMLFDEPTAHLDIETEHDLKNLIMPLLENKLVFFATHRLHWMKEMNIIFVLEDGKLVEAGSHEELYHKKGSYYHLIKALKGEEKHEVLSSIC
ncbi:thiol reductant ABC exporter subunit CydD [Robertmurraya massiliosenegalensis]